jgi:hypothetical protein
VRFSGLIPVAGGHLSRILVSCPLLPRWPFILMFQPSCSAARTWCPFFILGVFWRAVSFSITTAMGYCGSSSPVSGRGLSSDKTNSRRRHDPCMGRGPTTRGTWAQVVWHTCRDRVCHWLGDTSRVDVRLACGTWRCATFGQTRFLQGLVQQRPAGSIAVAGVSWHRKRLLPQDLCHPGPGRDIVVRFRVPAWRHSQRVVAPAIDRTVYFGVRCDIRGCGRCCESLE